MSDVEKPDLEEPDVQRPAAAAVANGGKLEQHHHHHTFLNKLSRFAIGSNQEELVDEKDLEDEHYEHYTPPPPATGFQKVKQHYARFWICYLIALIIGLAILLPCLFLLIVPRIAQDLLNSGSIVINNVSILQPRNDSMVMSVNASVYVPGPFTVQTSPMELQLYVPQNGSQYPMAISSLPAAQIHKNTTIVSPGRYTKFENYTTWQQFVRNIVFLNETQLGMQGPVTAQLGKIKAFSLNLNKVAPMTGLDQFPNYTIDSTALILPPESDGTNLVANVTLPNPSVLTLEIGTTEVDIYSGEIIIGTGVIENLLLLPGSNQAQIRGVANFTTLIDNLGTILGQQAPYIRNGYLALTARVSKISYNGSEIGYYTNEMSQVPLTAQTPVLGVLINTLKTFLADEAANGTNITAILANSTHADSDSEGSPSRMRRFTDVLENPAAFELIAKRHLEKLSKL